ncbi:PfkB family carbohydrate kinase [Candidatus Nitrosarchaeum limnium]|jgi:sugar/nucleoside kinase (ribokinase family)|uniref:Kinase, PfkB family n=1 Tax=Candidatus Nitrosarchaeum limnium BG20 TaxID=859192 RepID=S2E515_9ARCH|nr:PfkB family carbohydrate kinase [Candidatus Nitrosarchaeum limnium]EPA05848.1 kinase, PfkB family [Candidatus Nitrosarchaeum limnium BG20]
MKLALFSHCAIDSITIDGTTHEQIGGAACYGGLTARQLKFDVDLYTKFGKDFPQQYLTQNKINFENSLSDKLTTRFAIDIAGSDRTLKLLNQCVPLEFTSINADGSLVTPIFHEISNEMFSKIKKDSSFTLVDPQGFLRQVDSNNNVILKKTELDLSGVNAIKVNPEESQMLVDGNHDEMMKALQKKGVEHVIMTNKTEVSLLVKDKIYSLTLPNKEVYDTTGLGDIFCATFCCTMLKEKDFLWALCFAGGSAQAALDSKQVGLLKIPPKNAIETNASYFYNLVKYRSI